MATRTAEPTTTDSLDSSPSGRTEPRHCAEPGPESTSTRRFTRRSTRHSDPGSRQGRQRDPCKRWGRRRQGCDPVPLETLLDGHASGLCPKQHRRMVRIRTLAAGFMLLSTVLGGVLAAELNRYSSQDSAADQAPLPSTDPSAVAGAPSAPPASPAPSAVPSGPPSPAPSTSSGPGDRGRPSPAPSQAAGRTLTDTVAARLNLALGRLGCAPVTVDPDLVAAARTHVDQMLVSGYYNVVDEAGYGPVSRAREAGYAGTRVVESITIGVSTVVDAVNYAFPAPGTAARGAPANVQVISPTPLRCGWTKVGAASLTDTRQVRVITIVLGG